jgi:SAM-dependent methyltransferase
MTTATRQLDQARAEAFAGQVIGFYNGASMALMTSVGHRTGLFDAMATLPPSTSEQIARAASLDERYVREWLGAMTVARVVEHDPAKLTYALPPEHAASLTRAAGTGNLAVMSEYFAVMGIVEDQIVDCFRKGGGVPYSAYPKFQELMRQESAAVFDQTLVDATLPMVPGLVERLRQGIDVADVGCGAGHAINVMAKAFPNSRFVGYDFSEEGIMRARSETAEWSLKNARFEVQDAARLDGSTQFDFITVFDAIHDQAKPARVLSGIADALRPGGVFLCVDIQAHSTHAGNMEHPLAPFLYAISTFHCMTVSLAYGGDGLGTAWGEQLAIKMLNDAGFKNVEVKRVEGDIINNYYIATK